MLQATQDNATQPDPTRLEYDVWVEFIRKRCGLSFTAGRLRVLKQALWTRMQARACPDYTDYYHCVAFGPEGAQEWRCLLELLLNNETCFFRHAPSFDALSGAVIPDLLQRRDASGDPALRLWSAGCSAGQEAYSLAIAVLEGLGGRWWQPSVLGTDVSTASLQRARIGRYRPFEIRNLSETLRDRYAIECSASRDAVEYEMRPIVRDLVSFSEFNLTNPETYPDTPQDVIFCQNVLVYFSADDRREVVGRLANKLASGGYLLLGPADALGLQIPGLEPVRANDASVYRRAA